MIKQLTNCFNPEPGDYDVLYGKGRGVQKYQGNKNYRTLVNFYREDYSNGSTSRKTQIVEIILEKIKEKDGRFYRFISEKTFTGRWTELKKEEMQAKIRQTLRDSGKKTRGRKRQKS